MKILIEESTLRQALDALIDFNEQSIGGIALPAEIDTAMDALRTALKAAEKVEPVCEHQYIGAGLQPKFWRCLKCGEVKDAAPAVPEIKPHQIAQLVNTLRDIAVKYHDHQSLRERLAGPVHDLWRAKE